MDSALITRISEQHSRAVRALPAHLPGTARRRAAAETLACVGLPLGRDENWRYANLRPLERLTFTPALLGAADQLPAALRAADLPPPLPGYARYVFVDGAFAPALSAPLDATAVRVRPLATAPDGRHPGLADGATRAAGAADADQRFALLNEAFATDGAALAVPAGAGAAARLELLFLASADAGLGASYPRIELELEPRAELTLVERHASAAAAASFVTSAVTVVLGAGATLHHYRLQELAPGAILFDTLSAVLAADAAYRLHGIASGAQSARATLRVQLAGERADLALAALALGDRHQVQDAFALVEHLAPRTRTEQIFRGIAAGQARVAFNGKIVVARQAAGTDSRQSLRGLLAGPQAEIDVRPQLEIYTDEVRCSHGATAGKLDDDMLFYLLARGLEPASAQRLLKWAFLGDVFARIGEPELRRGIEQRLAARMQDGAAPGESP